MVSSGSASVKGPAPTGTPVRQRAILHARIKDSTSRMRAGSQKISGNLQCGDCLLTLDSVPPPLVPPGPTDAAADWRQWESWLGGTEG